MKHLLRTISPALVLLFALPLLAASPAAPNSPPLIPLTPGMLLQFPAKQHKDTSATLMAYPPLGGVEPITVSIYRTESETPPYSETTVLKEQAVDGAPTLVKDSKLHPSTTYYYYAVWKDRDGSVTSPAVPVKTTAKP